MTQITPLLSLHSGRVVCTSENVAKVFNRPLIDLMKRINSLDCSKAFYEKHFEPMDAVDGRGKSIVGCRMTREGFSLWAMSFVGKLEQKEAFLTAFEIMEELQKEEFRKQQRAIAPKAEPDPIERIEHIGCIVDQLLNSSTNAYPVSAEIRVELAKQVAKLAGIRLKAQPKVIREHHEVVQFWENVKKIGLEKLNHSRQVNVIAISLTEYQDYCLDMALPGCSKATLTTKLKFSQAMPVIGRKSIRSSQRERAGKTIQCWLFRAGDMLPESLSGMKTLQDSKDFIKEGK